jgi:uncharacterized membrane protein
MQVTGQRTRVPQEETSQVLKWGRRYRSCLKHSATSRKVAGLISDGIFEISYWLASSGLPMVLQSTEPLTETITKYLPRWVKTAGA